MSTNYNFTLVDNELLTRHGAALGPNGIAVYMALKAFAQGKGCCHPSRETIAKRIGTSVSTVKRTLPTLERAGLVRIEPHYVNNRQTVSTYHLLPVEKDQPADDGASGYPPIKDRDYDPLYYLPRDEAPVTPVVAPPPTRERLTVQAVRADIAAIRRQNRDFLRSLVDDAPELDAADVWEQAAD